MSYRDPLPEELNDPLFNRIWETIKSWDINVPSEYGGYCGATGNHVCAILDCLNDNDAARPSQPETVGEAGRQPVARISLTEQLPLKDRGEHGDVERAREIVKRYNEAFIDQENNTPRPGLVRMIAEALAHAAERGGEK